MIKLKNNYFNLAAHKDWMLSDFTLFTNSDKTISRIAIEHNYFPKESSVRNLYQLILDAKMDPPPYLPFFVRLLNSNIVNHGFLFVYKRVYVETYRTDYRLVSVYTYEKIGETEAVRPIDEEDFILSFIKDREEIRFFKLSEIHRQINEKQFTIQKPQMEVPKVNKGRVRQKLIGKNYVAPVAPVEVQAEVSISPTIVKEIIEVKKEPSPVNTVMEQSIIKVSDSNKYSKLDDCPQLTTIVSLIPTLELEHLKDLQTKLRNIIIFKEASEVIRKIRKINPDTNSFIYQQALLLSDLLRQPNPPYPNIANLSVILNSYYP